MKLPPGVEIRTATSDQLAKFPRTRLTRTARAWAVFWHGEFVGIAGLLPLNRHIFGFSAFEEGVLDRAPKMTIWRTANALMLLMTSGKRPFKVIADPDLESAPAFLERLGFEHVETSNWGEVYRWQIQFR